MHDQDKNNYFFLNREGRWPGFQWSGLELGDDGALRLARVPKFSGTLPSSIKDAPTPQGPAGLAVDCLGAIYFSDPEQNTVSRVDACDGSSAPLPCLGKSGVQLAAPRGLLIPRSRQALFVVDSGNHRIQVFDLKTLQLVQIWGQPNPGSSPQPSSQPGQFNTPWTLAGDSRGNVYVVDYGNQRVQKFTAIGNAVPEFWTKMQASGLLHQPSDIAVREQGGSCWVFVLDSLSSSIFIFDGSGDPVLGSDHKPLVATGPMLSQPMGLAVDSKALYVGDNARRRIYRFEVGDAFKFVGEAIGYDGPVATLLLNGKGDLLVHPSGLAAPIQLQARAGYRPQGVLWSNAIQVVDRKAAWHRLQSVIEPLAKNSHLDLFVYTTSKDSVHVVTKPSTNDDDLVILPDAANPFANPKWTSIPYSPNTDVTDLYIGGKEAKYLWIGGLFLSDGASSPALRQLRVEFDYPGYDQFLPALYRDETDCKEFLLRLLSLFESFNQEVEDEIAGLPALFDPKAAPKNFLPWLAGLLGLDLDENWGERKQRNIITEIFKLSGRRGTPAGLRDSLHLLVGIDAVIEEPIQHAAWWALPAAAESCCDSCAAHAAGGDSWQSTGDSILGWTTMLASAQPQGAVVGTSCDLDQSHLITNDDFGSPLFTDVAYRFTVGVYRGQVMCADVLPRIRAVLDQEKPAHTAYQICIIDPHFRVGFQSRVGVDTVVAGPPRSSALGEEQGLQEGIVLAGAPASRLGVATRLGITTTLG